MSIPEPMPPAPPESAPTTAYPPRFRWLKWGTLAFVITVLALIGLRLWWGHMADRRLRELTDAAHARGEPFLPEDFDPAPVPDTQNAALTFKRAGDALVVNSQYMAVENAMLSNPLTASDVQAIGAMLATNGAALKLARQAASQPKVDWGIRPRSPVLTTYPPPGLLNDQRALANLVGWAVLYDHAKENDRDAIQGVQDLLRQAGAVDAAGPCMVTHLVSLGLTGLVTNHIERIAADLSVAPHAPTSAATPATRQQVDELIAALLDEQSFREGAVRSWHAERMMELDAVENMAAGVPDPLREWWSIKPMFDLDGLRLARQLTQTARAAAQPSWPAARAFVPPPATDTSQMAQATRYISTMLGPASSGSLTQHFRALTDRRAAAIALAIRLYRLDHQDQYPASLAELVPAYLPRVPADPMAADGRAFAYKPRANPPVIYSVGEDGKDDGGTSLPTEAPHGYRWQQPDAVYPLARPSAAATQPSSQTQNDQ